MSSVAFPLKILYLLCRYLSDIITYIVIGYEQPWEEKNWEYPNNFASSLQIIIEASNGASDYGNKFGEPVVSGKILFTKNISSNRILP